MARGWLVLTVAFVETLTSLKFRQSNSHLMSSHFPLRNGNDSGALSRRALLVGIIGITLLGFYLRYRCLGCLGFRWDEDLTSLAVKALL